jgi:Ca2+-binding EF-hand superfamily protein
MLFRWCSGPALMLAFSLSAGTLTAQEASPKPEELFQQLDKNGDGKLTADEIAEEQKRFFERQLRVGDQNRDGALSREEFLQASRPAANPSVPLGPLGGPGGRPGQAGDLRQRFEMLDRNRDGKLTLEELPEPFRDRMKPLFDRLGKQEISLDEYGRMAGGPPGGRPEPGELFNRLDRNGDGKLEKTELPAEAPPFLAPLFERLGKDVITREEFLEAGRRLFAQAPGQPGEPPRTLMQPRILRLLDANGDGRLSKEELVQLAEKFQELDDDRDGQLDPRELLGLPDRAAFNPLTTPPEGQRPGDRGPAFSQLDRNGDGKISQEEAPDWLRDNFRRLDRDGDGFITPDEMRLGFTRPGRPRPDEAPRRPEGDAGRPRRPASGEPNKTE